MVYQLYAEDYQYFPSLEEIRDGLIKAHMKIIANDFKNYGDKI